MIALSKCSPKEYYQIMNILIKPNKYNHVIPIAHVIMSNKSYLLHMNVFNDIKFLLKLKKIRIILDNIYFITDQPSKVSKIV